VAKVRRWSTRPIAVVCVILAMVGGSFPDRSVAADADDTARVVAGMQPGSNASGKGEGPWHAYAQEVSASWAQNEKRIRRPLRQWACQEVERTEQGAVFYPFSGPDLPWAFDLFPEADRYVLAALEKAEAPPRLESFSKEELEGYMAAFRKAWRFYGTEGFFRTNDLVAETQAKGTRLGITGPLMAFAVRLGFEIEAVEPIVLDLNTSQLNLRDPEPARDDTWDSVRLTLRKDGRRVLVDYVRMDLSDTSLRKASGARRWIERMATNPTILKAASHHPQGLEFSIFRNSVLENAPVVVQDETGIDYAPLSQAFAVRLYGKFTKPNAAFEQNLQQSLASAYQKTPGVKPLPFRLGYEKGAGSALQVAVRNTKVARLSPTCGR
jgi:hypothetical protein